MTDFQKFWEGEKSAEGLSIVEPAMRHSVETLTSALALDMSDPQRQLFADNVVRAATSDDVIAQVSTELGQPLPLETEEQFVERASIILRRILNALFGIRD